MEKRFDINEFIFGRTKPKKKLEVINKMSDNDIRKATPATILRIYKECRGDRDRFYVDCKRREGNNWDSTIEFIYEYNNKPYLCLYVQNSSTDSSTCVSYQVFNNVGNYEGYCENLSRHFTYTPRDIARTIRCIISEYVYWKYIEKPERERAERIRKTLYIDGKFAKICDYFYDEWRCKYEDFGFRSPTPRTNRYHRAKKAITSYVEEHIDELYGKPSDELQAIFKKMFRETN